MKQLKPKAKKVLVEIKQKEQSSDPKEAIKIQDLLYKNVKD